MVSCWEPDPLDRPIARDMIEILRDLIAHDGTTGRDEPDKFLMPGDSPTFSYFKKNQYGWLYSFIIISS